MGTSHKFARQSSVLAVCLGFCLFQTCLSLSQESAPKEAGVQEPTLYFKETAQTTLSKPTPDVSSKTAWQVCLAGHATELMVTPLKSFDSNRTLAVYPWLIFHERADNEEVKLDETLIELLGSKRVDVSQKEWSRAVWAVYYDPKDNTFAVEFHIEFFPAVFINLAIQCAEQESRLNRLTGNVPGKEIAVRPVGILPEDADIRLFYTEHGKEKLLGSSNLESLVPDVCVGTDVESYHRVIVRFVDYNNFATFLDHTEDVRFQMWYSYEGYDSTTIRTEYKVDETKVAEQIFSLFNDGHNENAWDTKYITQSQRNRLDGQIKSKLSEKTLIDPGAHSSEIAQYLITAFYQKGFNPIELLTEQIEWEDLGEDARRELSTQMRADFERNLLQAAQKYAQENEVVNETLTDEIQRDIDASHVDAQTGFSGFCYLYFYGDINGSTDHKSESQREEREALVRATADKMGLAVEHLKDKQQFKLTAANLYRVKRENVGRLASLYRECSVLESRLGLEKTEFFSVKDTVDAVNKIAVPKNVPMSSGIVERLEAIENALKEIYQLISNVRDR